ncbi:helix-turn-helix transcriptional regulator [Larkinella sp. C7]|uniref:helix-turn-helix domain-containing protein n=1 Tax=Larkinella sp. C7 TaxID=2576607 RepID=UPI0011111BB8|nr:helix-turn-helix transcriptional regulator [Larkinella sp. C7]
MEPKKRKRGELSRQILASITPQEHARTFKQMAIAARIADALEAKGWSKSEFASRMNQLPSVVTRWLSGTQNFTIDTLSDIEEMLGVQLLVTDVTRPTAPTAGTPLLSEVVELGAETPAAVERLRERVIEHHYVPVFYNAEPVVDSCQWTESPGTIKYCRIINPSPSLN